MKVEGDMLGLSRSALLFWGGIGTMAGAVLLTILCVIVFVLSGRKLKKVLEQEYGKPYR